jgi:hypothetical protein
VAKRKDKSINKGKKYGLLSIGARKVRATVDPKMANTRKEIQPKWGINP